jgi:ribose transport system permease protein
MIAKGNISVAGTKLAGASNRWAPTLEEVGPIALGAVALFVLSGVLAPGTLAYSALITMLPFAGVLILVGVGQTIVIQQRGLDLSVPGLVSTGGLVVTYLAMHGTPILVAVLLGLALGVLAGAVNGFLVAKVNITPLVTTLAVNALLLGVADAVSGGATLAAPHQISRFCYGRIVGVPNPLVVALVVVGLVSFTAKRTATGRRFVAVGAKPAAASASGISARRYVQVAYIVSGVCGVSAGILLAGSVSGAQTASGNEYLLSSIAAVVVGGTPVTGGRGSVVATAIAALFLTQLGQLVVALGAPQAAQLGVQAVAIGIAATIRHIPLPPALRRRTESSAGSRDRGARGRPGEEGIARVGSTAMPSAGLNDAVAGEPADNVADQPPN